MNASRARGRWATLLLSVVAWIALGLALLAMLGGSAGEIEVAVIGVLVIGGLMTSLVRFNRAKTRA